MTTPQWPVTRTHRIALPTTLAQKPVQPPQSAPAIRVAPPSVQPVQPPAKAPTVAGLSAPPPVGARPAQRAITPLPVGRVRKPVQPPVARTATPLPAPSPDGAPPLSVARAVGGNPGAQTKPAPSAIRDQAERRASLLRGQIGQDCATLSNASLAVGRRIATGETPRQEGEFMVLARRLDQNCASLYELQRLLKCY